MVELMYHGRLRWYAMAESSEEKLSTASLADEREEQRERTRGERRRR